MPGGSRLERCAPGISQRFLAAPDPGLGFHVNTAGGPAGDHWEPARRIPLPGCVKARAMRPLRSAWHDPEGRKSAVPERGMDSRNFVFCTNDCLSGTLFRDWHMDRVVRHTMDWDRSPLVAMRMVTLDTAQHLELERERGSIAPGHRADLILTNDLKTLPIFAGCNRGSMLGEKGKIRVRSSELEIDEENFSYVLEYERQ